MSLNTTPATWVAGTTVTAAQMNTEIRDALTGLQAAWTTYTTTPTGISVGNGTLAFSAARQGKTVLGVRGRFAAGSTTTYSAATLQFTAPFAPSSAYTAVQDFAIGSATLQPTTTRLGGTVLFTVGGAFCFMVDNLTSGTIVTNLVPGTWAASTAVLSFTCSYEAA